MADFDRVIYPACVTVTGRLGYILGKNALNRKGFLYISIEVQIIKV